MSETYCSSCQDHKGGTVVSEFFADEEIRRYSTHDAAHTVIGWYERRGFSVHTNPGPGQVDLRSGRASIRILRVLDDKSATGLAATVLGACAPHYLSIFE